MTAERPAEALETFSARARGYASESSWVSDPRLLDPLIAGLDGGAVLADVCSGTGAVGKLAIGRGIRVVAVDLSIEMLLQSSLPQKVVGSGGSLPLADRSVDRVACRQGLHYLNVEQALREFARVARLGIAIGTITMLEESDRQFWTEYFRLASPGRLVTFAPGDVARAGERVGLQVAERTVIEDRGSLLGPIQHLPEPQVREIRDSFASRDIRSRYEVQTGDDGDLSYLQRWEFTLMRLPFSNASR